MTAEVSYRYLRPSALGGASGHDLELATFTPTLAEPPVFFSGFARRAEVLAAGLLVVARVARTRFYVPPTMTAAAIRAADPVVTSDGERLRFESLSVCCGVYARLDLLPDGIDGEVLGHGTTNVDVNTPLRDALGRVRPGDPMRLDVGHDQLRVTILDGEVVERKVPLPARWLRSLAEVAQMSSTLVLRFTLDPAEARRVVLGLPGRQTRGGMWLSPAGRSARLTTRPHGSAVYVSGPERITDPLAPALRFAARVTAYGQPADAARPAGSAWVLDLPGARLTLALSPAIDRAFSGEGGVLGALATDEALVDAEVVSDTLARTHCGRRPSWRRIAVSRPDASGWRWVCWERRASWATTSSAGHTSPGTCRSSRRPSPTCTPDWRRPAPWSTAVRSAWSTVVRSSTAATPGTSCAARARAGAARVPGTWRTRVVVARASTRSRRP